MLQARRSVATLDKAKSLTGQGKPICILMKTEVFRKLEKPYFEFRFKEDTKDWFGEDFILQDKIQKVGYEIFVDTMLSMEIKHVGIYAF
jgi:hypothetical protein